MNVTAQLGNSEHKVQLGTTDPKHPEIELHAQTWTIGFYEKLGFAAEGPEFLEAEIPHRRMVRQRQRGTS